jgi:hypothetical protein
LRVTPCKSCTIADYDLLRDDPNRRAVARILA